MRCPLELEGATWFFFEGEEEKDPQRWSQLDCDGFLVEWILYKSGSLELEMAFGKETWGKQREKYFSLIKKEVQERRLLIPLHYQDTGLVVKLKRFSM